MKIHALGSKNQKRAVRLVLEAENEVEEAILFEKFEGFCKEPPQLAPWYDDILKTLGSAGRATPSALAHRLRIGVTCSNNRVAYLFRLNLVDRRKENVASGGRNYVYWLNQRDADASPPSDTLEGDDD